MGWWIIIALLLVSRTKPAPQPATASVLYRTRTSTPISSPEISAGLTEVGPGVFLPDQQRDTVSKKIHAVASVGPTTLQQQQTLLSLGTNVPDASFSLEAGTNQNFANVLALNRSGVNFAPNVGDHLE